MHHNNFVKLNATLIYFGGTLALYTLPFPRTILWILSLNVTYSYFPKSILAILPFKIFSQKFFYGTAQNRLTPILPTLSCLSSTCNFTKIQKVCDFCRYWLKRKNTPYGKANLAIRCILIISHFP